MLTSFAQWCTRDQDADMLAAFPGLRECKETPSELVEVRAGLVFEEMLPFPVKGAFLPEAKDASKGNCNAGSLGCACITLSSTGKGAVAMSDGTGNCALGLECKRLVCQRANVTTASAAQLGATTASLASVLLALLTAQH